MEVHCKSRMAHVNNNLPNLIFKGLLFAIIIVISWFGCLP